VLASAFPPSGNVRELDNVMQRALILANGPVIGREHIQMEEGHGLRPSGSGQPELTHEGRSNDVAGGRNARSGEERAPLSSAIEAAEREAILEALRAGGSREEAAKRLGISPRTLRYKLARLREAGITV
jgi:two-component system response regulator FlrC